MPPYQPGKWRGLPKTGELSAIRARHLLFAYRLSDAIKSLIALKCDAAVQSLALRVMRAKRLFEGMMRVEFMQSSTKTSLLMTALHHLTQVRQLGRETEFFLARYACGS
jgi:hypothetical protein